ncbi:hypothetical protein IscW_ISCW007842 [Ixodes scapularis]|uniref:CUB domain-containing protein n=1 Tax=Ixodes scapularis TaxID=6945 RepID=B7PWQ7_IXOSC|nr:hypothetical protein IscW_ISCW007842 [Ixodes scapularis]|eukprot:XP_002410189.1 hypothetical protein IscW_ISCW007842 [Ixodes scapularis]
MDRVCCLHYDDRWTERILRALAQFQEVRLSGGRSAQIELFTEAEAGPGLSVTNGSVLKGKDRWLALTVRACGACFYRAVFYAMASDGGERSNFRERATESRRGRAESGGDHSSTQEVHLDSHFIPPAADDGWRERNTRAAAAMREPVPALSRSPGSRTRSLSRASADLLLAISGGRCNATLTQARGEWHSPRHPAFYPPGLHCSVTIQAPTGHRVLVRIPFLELPPLNSPSCDQDSLVLGPLVGYGAESVVLCGSRRNLTYLSLHENVRLDFRSDSLVEAEGWTVKYEFVQLCRNETLQEASGRVCHPPGKAASLLYSAPGDCHLSLFAPLGYEFQLSFGALQVSAARGSSSCPDSFLEVSSGGVEHRFCGNWTGSPEVAALRSTGNVMLIRVHMEDVGSLRALGSAKDELGFCAVYNTLLVNESLAEGCQFGWVSWGLHCYRVFNESAPWARANDVCVQQGGHLASVTGEPLQALLDAMLFTRRPAALAALVRSWLTMLSLLSWLHGVPVSPLAGSEASAMSRETYGRTVAELQSRIQRLEENLKNSRTEAAQKSAVLQELRKLCLEKDDQMLRDIEEVNDIRKDFEELKRLYAKRCRRKMCVII